MESQSSGDALNMAMPASVFRDISAAENQRELDFAIAAGDVDASAVAGLEGNVNNLEENAGHHEGEAHGANASVPNEEVMNEEDGIHGTSPTERAASESSNQGSRQLNLKHWLL